MNISNWILDNFNKNNKNIYSKRNCRNSNS